MKKILSFFSLLLVLLSPSISMGQGRSFIKECIDKYGECRNVAITRTNGDVMLYGKNGWAANACPADLTRALRKLHDRGEYIDDVQLTENGRWLILYGNNGFMWNDIPASLEQKLHQYHDDDEVVTSVTFNDDGDWIIISKDYFNASSPEISDWLKEGIRSNGKLWAACLTDDALVAVYERGYSIAGNVPESLKRALKETNLNVYRLKIAGSAWFFANNIGTYHYNM